jgi:hypothetical protein
MLLTNDHEAKFVPVGGWVAKTSVVKIGPRGARTSRLSNKTQSHPDQKNITVPSNET